MSAALKPLRKSVKLRKRRNGVRPGRERPPSGGLYKSGRKRYIDYRERPINSSGSSSKLQKSK